MCTQSYQKANCWQPALSSSGTEYICNFIQMIYILRTAGGTDVLSYNNGITYKATSQLITSMELAMACHLRTPQSLQSTEQQCNITRENKPRHITTLNICIIILAQYCTWICATAHTYSCNVNGSVKFEQLDAVNHYLHLTVHAQCWEVM
jgi:hypothetical protein